MAHLKEKKDKSKETFCKDLMADLQDKNIKTTVLKCSKTKEDVEKLKKMRCEQNGNIIKETENLKRSK